MPALSPTERAFSGDLTGQVTVTTAGTPVSGPEATGVARFLIKAHPDNTGVMWVIGQSATDGYPLGLGQSYPTPQCSLESYKFDADVSGEKICWAVIE